MIKNECVSYINIIGAIIVIRVNRMNKLSLSVLGHILLFVDDTDLLKIVSVNNKFKMLMASNVRYKYQQIKRNWLMSISSRVAKEHKDNLDIGLSENGEFIMYLVNYRAFGEHNIYDVSSAIHEHSSLFVNAGILFNWKIHPEPWKKFIMSSDIICGNPCIIIHKTIVYPCRIHKIPNVAVHSMSLYYYPYLQIIIPINDIIIRYGVNNTLLLGDFYTYLTKDHTEFVKEYAVYIVSQIATEISKTRNDGSYTASSYVSQPTIPLEWQIETLNKKMNLLVEQQRMNDKDNKRKR